MTAKQYLKQGYRLKELIQTHREELAQLRDMVGSIQSPNWGKVGVGANNWNGQTREQILAVRVMDLEQQIEEEIADMVQLMQRIHNAVESVPNQDQRLALRCRYILFLSWAETADRMNYSCQQARRIHDDALRSVAAPEDESK